MNKREYFEMIIDDIESLAVMSKFYPEIFDKVVSDKELERLEGLTSDLAGNVEMQIDGSGELGKGIYYIDW